MHKLTMHAKDFMGSAMTNGKIIALTATGAIVAQKMLDLEAIGAKAGLAADNPIIKHQGAVKVVGVIAANHFFAKKMPDMVKWALIGVGIQGALQEIRVLAGDDKIPQIGNEDKAIDEQMKKAAEEIKAAMKGNPTNEYPTSVSGNPTNEYPTSVSGMGGFGSDFELHSSSGVGFSDY
jgi:hypothetical protein